MRAGNMTTHAAMNAKKTQTRGRSLHPQEEPEVDDDADEAEGDADEERRAGYSSELRELRSDLMPWEEDIGHQAGR
jgi:hypothetical protein